jgi:glycosyltransferase involved in cell wall biosynthesis
VLAGDEAAARHAARPYDLFVFQLGNSGFHVYMLPLLRRFGGVVVVHDFHLGGLLGEAIRLGTWPVGRAEALEQMGEGHVANWLKLGAVDDAITPSLAPQVRPFVEHADALVVHSAWAWERLRDQSDAPVLRVPMAVPLPPAEPPSELRARFGLPPGRFLVGTLGHVYYHKRMPTLLRAVAGLPADLRERTEVVVVGPAETVEHDAIVRMAGGLGLDGQLRMVGHVSLEDLHNYARACDVCVQLRYPTHGETSAALLRAMAAGAACVTSAVGPLREIPNHAAWKVRSPAHEVSDLTAALVRLAVNPAQRVALGRAARAYMAGHHAPGETAARYAALMDQAIAKRTARGAGWAARAGAALAGVADAPAVAGRWAALRAAGQASAPPEITRAA